MGDDDIPEEAPTSADDDSPVVIDLERFLARNGVSALGGDDEHPYIDRPWDDDTLVLRLDSPTAQLRDALQHCLLPPAFSAVIHDDTDQMEVIWGPIPAENPIHERWFDFWMDGRSYSCAYRPASERLLALATAFRPMKAPTSTGHRNLESLAYFQRTLARRPELAERLKPTSFFIGPVADMLESGELVRLARHINFYMSYFDLDSPRILVHAEKAADAPSVLRAPLPFDTFPPSVAAKAVDPYLLGLWESARDSADPFREFLHLYQILEYAGFYHLDTQTHLKLMRLLSAPDVSTRPEEVARQLLDVLTDDRRRDEAKMIAVIGDLVEPSVIWRQFEPNMTYFSERLTFDGGFVVDPLLREEWSEEDFRAAWLPKWPDALRKIRNALVHAREARMADVIAPTRANSDWSSPR